MVLRFFQIAGLIALLLVLGCTTTQPISDISVLAGIHNVTVSENVAITKQPKIFGKAASTGFFFGPIIGAVVAETATAESLEFKKFLEDHRIDIRQIVRQEFVATIVAIHGLPTIVAEGGDANFDLAIQDYGLAPGFSLAFIDKPLSPTLMLGAKLLSRDGRVLWKDTKYITALSKGNLAYRIADYYDNPNLIEEGFRKAAHVLAEELLRDLKGN
jgi:hypothetical protein